MRPAHPIRLLRRSTLAFAALSLAGCALPVSLDDPVVHLQGVGQQAPWIPLELHRDRMPFFEVRVNGRPTPALLDSGASVSCVSSTFAAELGLGRGRRIGVSGVGGRQRARLADGVRLDLGGVVLEDLQVLVLDFGPLERLLGRPLPVVVGSEVFEAAIVDLDYPNRRLAFRDPQAFEAPAGSRRLDLRGDRSGWYARVEVEAFAPIMAQLDTGSAGTLTLFARWVEEVRLLEGREGLSTLISGGVGGYHETTRLSVESVRFGGELLRDVPVRASPPGKGSFANAPGQANLGGGLLGRFRVVFDVPNRALHLSPGEGVDEPFARDRAGLALAHEPDRLVVLHVAPDSPAAAAGWREGEVVTAIDGRPVAECDHAQRFDWTRGSAGTQVELIDGDGRVRRLELADYPR